MARGIWNDSGREFAPLQQGLHDHAAAANGHGGIDGGLELGRFRDLGNADARSGFVGLDEAGQSEFVDEFLRRPRPTGCDLHGPSYGLALFRQKRRRTAFVKSQGHGICIPRCVRKAGRLQFGLQLAVLPGRAVDHHKSANVIGRISLEMLQIRGEHLALHFRKPPVIVDVHQRGRKPRAVDVGHDHGRRFSGNLGFS